MRPRVVLPTRRTDAGALSTPAGTSTPNRLVVFDGDDFNSLHEVTLSRQTAVIAVDETHATLLSSNARVIASPGKLSESDFEMAPWLLNSLHVRTIHRDEDRSARRVP